MRAAVMLLIASLIGVAPQPAFAWGYEGHEIVALIAYNYLTPSVRSKVSAMLKSDRQPNRP